MKTRIFIVGLLLSIHTGLILAQRRGFTVRDSIEMTRFDDPGELQQRSEAKFSPDLRHFVVVTSGGLIRSNRIVSTIFLFDSEAVRRFVNAKSVIAVPGPRALVRLSQIPVMASSIPYTSIISEVRWSEDSKAVYFLAQNEKAERQLFSVDIVTRRLFSLSKRGRDVTEYAVHDGVIFLVAWREAKGESAVKQRLAHWPKEGTGTAVTGMPIAYLLFPSKTEHPLVREIWVSRKAAPKKVITPMLGTPNLELESSLFSVSPRGSKVIELLPVSEEASSWSRYLPAFRSDIAANRMNDSRNISQLNPHRLRVYALTDLDDGRTKPIIDGPFGGALGYGDKERVIWSKDERRVLVTNVFLSLVGVDDQEEYRRLRPCAVAEVTLQSFESHCIVFQQRSIVEAHDRSSLIQVEDVA